MIVRLTDLDWSSFAAVMHLFDSSKKIPQGETYSLTDQVFRF